MKLIKAVLAAAALVMAATVMPPQANAQMQLGNYDLNTNRYSDASWLWVVSSCIPEKSADCVLVAARPRLQRYAYYGGRAYLGADGRYTMTVDVPDGLLCPGQRLPTRETYSWDQLTFVGTIESVYDVGCFNGPPGSQFWTFQLQRL